MKSNVLFLVSFLVCVLLLSTSAQLTETYEFAFSYSPYSPTSPTVTVVIENLLKLVETNQFQLETGKIASPFPLFVPPAGQAFPHALQTVILWKNTQPTINTVTLLTSTEGNVDFISPQLLYFPEFDVNKDLPQIQDIQIRFVLQTNAANPDTAQFVDFALQNPTTQYQPQIQPKLAASDDQVSLWVVDYLPATHDDKTSRNRTFSITFAPQTVPTPNPDLLLTVQRAGGLFDPNLFHLINPSVKNRPNCSLSLSSRSPRAGQGSGATRSTPVSTQLSPTGHSLTILFSALPVFELATEYKLTCPDWNLMPSAAQFGEILYWTVTPSTSPEFIPIAAPTPLPRISTNLAPPMSTNAVPEATHDFKFSYLPLSTHSPHATISISNILPLIQACTGAMSIVDIRSNADLSDKKKSASYLQTLYTDSAGSSDYTSTDLEIARNEDGSSTIQHMGYTLPPDVTVSTLSLQYTTRLNKIAPSGLSFPFGFYCAQPERIYYPNKPPTFQIHPEILHNINTTFRAASSDLQQDGQFSYTWNATFTTSSSPIDARLNIQIDNPSSESRGIFQPVDPTTAEPRYCRVYQVGKDEKGEPLKVEVNIDSKGGYQIGLLFTPTTRLEAGTRYLVSDCPIYIVPQTDDQLDRPLRWLFGRDGFDTLLPYPNPDVDAVHITSYVASPLPPPGPTPEPDPSPDNNKTSHTALVIFAIILALLVGIGCVYLLNKKGKLDRLKLWWKPPQGNPHRSLLHNQQSFSERDNFVQ